MTLKRWLLTGSAVLIATVVGVLIWALWPPPDRCRFLDEAACIGKTAADFDATTTVAVLNYLRDMDGGIELTPEEAAGRNTWVMWSAGNQAFWDHLSRNAFGAFDLLKTLSSHPDNKAFSRDNRFGYMGLINEPGFRKPEAPDQYGLWLDERVGPQDPFDEDIYGRASGIVGLRLFPNPAFDAKAKRQWDPDRYYSDPNYYQDSDLVRPYRVGMSCGFCHVSPNPVHPPDDPESPEWENLASNVGAQYFWSSRVMVNALNKDNYLFQMVDAWPPGTLDTSIIASDGINNPRTMNALYNLKERLAIGEVEMLGEDNLDVSGTMPSMQVPHVLKDGSDSVGIIGALSRVYFNIGEFHQEWVRHFKLLVPGAKQTPLPIALVKENSVYYQATDARLANLAAFFVKATEPHLLQDAPGGTEYLTNDQDQLTRGKIAFADNCATCHSSKKPQEAGPPGSPEYIQAMRELVQQPDFIEGNYLSDDHRYSVAEIGTNSCFALATNGRKGHVWDNFTSETYKNLPSVGVIQVYNPITMQNEPYEMPSGGRGYARTPSLVSMWSTAPFLHNNSVGIFTGDPSVEGRMTAFDDAIIKLLWPETRDGLGSIYRTDRDTYLDVKKGFLPKILRPLLGLFRWVPGISADGVRIEVLPAGTPVNLLGNLNLEIENKDDIADLLDVLRGLKKIKKGQGLSAELGQKLFELSKCPDFITDRGHEYGSDLSDEDKQALIEFLKRF